MTRREAVNAAIHNASRYGGEWHVVRLGEEYYEVHKAWFKNHRGKSLFNVDFYSADIKISLKRRVIRAINRFLLWLLGKWVYGSGNKNKT